MPTKLIGLTELNSGVADPNKTKPKRFVNGSPELWSVAFTQMANAGVSQDAIDAVYRILRVSTRGIQVSQGALNILNIYKISAGPSSEDAETIVSWLGHAFSIVNGTSDYPHSPALDALKSANPEGYTALNIAKLLDDGIDLQNIQSASPAQLSAAADLASQYVTKFSQPYDDAAVAKINGALHEASPQPPQQDETSGSPASNGELPEVTSFDPPEEPADDSPAFIPDVPSFNSSTSGTPTAQPYSAQQTNARSGSGEGREKAGAQWKPQTKYPIPARVLSEVFNHAGNKEQILDAVSAIEKDIESNSPNAQFLLHYVPGVTSDIVKDILINRTDSGKYVMPATGKSGGSIPHTNLSGGHTFVDGDKTRYLNPVEVPPGFSEENSSVLWDEPVITTMGFPFINFGSPEIQTILKDKRFWHVREAYWKVKKMLKKIGLSSPIKVLQDFHHAKGVRCALNRITIDAQDVLNTTNAELMVEVYPRNGKHVNSSIGTVQLTRDFIIEMYNVLSPTKGAKVYMDMLHLPEEEYATMLNRDGHPPVYIFVPKEHMMFTKAPAGFIAKMLTRDKKPTLVEAKIGTHFGGFVMPFKTSQMIFSEV
jgi:hypothetical protein